MERLTGMDKLAGSLLGATGRRSTLAGSACTHFVAGGFKIDMKGIQRRHRHLGAPVLHVTFGPASVQANGPGNVFRKRLAVIPLASKNIANQPPRVHLENAPASLTCGIHQAQKNFPRVAEFLAVVPSLRGVDFRMMAAGAF